MSEETPLGDAKGQWYYCFKHDKVETREECRRGDRLGPYPTPEDAANWRQRVEQRNEAWDSQEDEDDQ